MKNRVIAFCVAVIFSAATLSEHAFADISEIEVAIENNDIPECSNSTSIANNSEESTYGDVEEGVNEQSNDSELSNEETVSVSEEDNIDIIAEGTCNESIIWKITSDETLIISGNGIIPNYSDSGYIYRAPWYDYRDYIKALIIEEGITAVTNYNFYGLLYLEEVELPYSLSNIGLETSSFPHCFKGCTNLKKVFINETTTYIAGSAFESDVSFTIVGKTNSVAEIYARTKEINFESDGMFIPSGCFGDDGEWIIDDGELTITGSGSVSYRDITLYSSLIDQVNIAETVSAIDDTYKLFTKINATKITIPVHLLVTCEARYYYLKSVKELHVTGKGPMINYTTSGRTGWSPLCESTVESIKIDDGVTNYATGFSNNCPYLQKIVIPNSVKEFNFGSVVGSTQLKDIYFPKYIKLGGTVFSKQLTIHGYEFSLAHKYADTYKIPFSKTGTFDGEKIYVGDTLICELHDNTLELYNTNVPEGYITNSEFYTLFCYYTKKIIVHEGITDIGLSYFQEYSSLFEIVFPNSLEHFDLGWYPKCNNIKRLTIPVAALNATTGYTSSSSNDVLKAIRYIKIIGDGEIQGNRFLSKLYNLDYVFISDGIVGINSNSFFSYATIKTIRIPESVNTLAVNWNPQTANTVFIVDENTPAYNYLVNRGLSYTIACTEHSGGIPRCIIGAQCSYCQMEYTDADINNHEWGYISASEPSCETSGSTFGRYCTLCLNADPPATTLPATGHSVVIDKDAVEPTCTDSGNTEEAHCSICGKTISELVEIPALGHSIVYKEAIDPTYTETGLSESSYCSVCNQVFKEQRVIPSLSDGVSINGYSLSLFEDGALGLNFYISVNEDIRIGQLSAVLSTESGDPIAIQLDENCLVDEREKAEESNLFKISIPVNAAQLNDQVTVMLLSDNNTFFTMHTSVVEYADSILNTDTNLYANEKQLIKSVLNYGACVQKYFNYEVDNLANSILPSEDQIMVPVATDYAKYKSEVDGYINGLMYYGTSLLLKSDVTIRHYFIITNDSDIKDYSFGVDGVSVSPVRKGDLYYVDIAGINPGMLDHTYTLSIEKNENMLNLVYSAMSYLSAAKEHVNSNNSLIELLECLNAYGKHYKLFSSTDI